MASALDAAAQWLPHPFADLTFWPRYYTTLAANHKDVRKKILYDWTKPTLIAAIRIALVATVIIFALPVITEANLVPAVIVAAYLSLPVTLFTGSFLLSKAAVVNFLAATALNSASLLSVAKGLLFLKGAYMISNFAGECLSPHFDSSLQELRGFVETAIIDPLVNFCASKTSGYDPTKT